MILFGLGLLVIKILGLFDVIQFGLWFNSVFLFQTPQQWRPLAVILLSEGKDDLGDATVGEFVLVLFGLRTVRSFVRKIW